ncbi:MAG: hypothetical protein EZS28_008179 [Streblomastix strix]|uniref:Uncharacterized protein n=1 Tax=Streblomastix strix TaxID=222440 RepID=A0A5J4WMU8_9EUKA|nr:MAG: hypothetical protein EZS28_008179 [Streblomastix strix]
MSKKDKKQLIPAYVQPAQEQPATYQEDMAQRGTMFIDGEDVDLNQVTKVPQILKYQGVLLKKHMGAIQKQRIVDKIRAIDPSLTQKEATTGLLGLTNKTMNRQAYGQYFGEDLRAEFFENTLMLNNEGKLVTENIQRIHNDTDLGQISSFEDQPPTMPLMQEKLIEKQQQAIEKDLASQENLAQIYDIGSLDWGRMPVNDQFNRQQFKTQKTGYQMNADGSISAIVKKENTKITPGEKKLKTKKNYIPTSQLLQSAKEQSSFKKKKRVKK